MTTYTADTILEDQIAAELLAEIREAGERRLEEKIMRPLKPSGAPGTASSWRGEFERHMHRLEETAAEYAPCSRWEMYRALNDAAIKQAENLLAEHERLTRQNRTTVFVIRQIAVSEAILGAFDHITR